jgi:hypothetical protein
LNIFALFIVFRKILHFNKVYPFHFYYISYVEFGNGGDMNVGLGELVCNYGGLSNADAATQNDEWRKACAVTSKRRTTAERAKTLTVVFC